MADALGWRPNYNPKVSLFDDLGTRLKHFIKTTFGWYVVDLSTFGHIIPNVSNNVETQRNL